jgi:hypothetical protein
MASTTSSSFGDELAGWSLDNTVGWLLDLPGRLQHREALMIHLVQNEFDGTKLVQLFRTWQWDWERARAAGGAEGVRLVVKGRPRDLVFSDADSKQLYDETVRLCGHVLASLTHTHTSLDGVSPALR